MSAFIDQLKMFRGEQEAAQQYFFTFLALNNTPAASERILQALNQFSSILDCRPARFVGYNYRVAGSYLRQCQL